jgi:hypothetical protein
MAGQRLAKAGRIKLVVGKGWLARKGCPRLVGCR